MVHGLRFLEMQPAHSISHISSSTNFQYLSGMEYGLGGIGDHVVWLSISNRLVPPTSVHDFVMMESNLFCNSRVSLSQAS